MKPLDRKLFRDIWKLKGQVLAIALVLAAGIAMFVLSNSNYDSLVVTRANYYRGNRFADVFANCKRAPLSLLEKIESIEGVAWAQGRIIQEVTLDVAGMKDPATARMVSLKIPYRPGLNDPYLRAGRFPEPEATNEVLANEAFMLAHGFSLGQQVKAVINGRSQTLTIVGQALSPEFIYAIKPGSMLPDNLRYGIFWMNERALEASMNMEGAFNEVSLRLTREALLPEVLDRLDTLLKPYGGLHAHGRKDQTSHWFLENELMQLRSMGFFIPLVFFLVAVFLLNLVVARQIRAQREQIAVLKAFGYSDGAIGLHYMKFVMTIVALGNLLGIGFGAYLGSGMVAMYAEFFKFPELTYILSSRIIIGAFFFSSLTALIGTWSMMRRAMRLPPAEAMRPEPPATYRPSIAERLGFGHLLPIQVQMILRHLERSPLRTLLSGLGIAMATGLLVLGRGNIDSINYLIRAQFQFIQRQDVTVTFYEPQTQRSFNEIHGLPGVIHAEPTRSVAVKLVLANHEKRTAVIGMPNMPLLQRPLDSNLKPIPIPNDGLMIDRFLAKKLGVVPGQTLTLEVLEGERPTLQAQVVGLVDEYLGTNVYMNLASLNRLLQEDRVITGAYMSIDARSRDPLFDRLKNTPKVAGITITDAAVNSFKDTVAKNIFIMNFFNILFSGIIAFGVVFNSAQMSLNERSRDLATLRVLGFTRAEISAILLGELAIITLVAIPVGFVLGTGLGQAAMAGMQSEQFRFPYVIQPATFGLTTLTVCLSALISGLMVRRKLDRLDLMAVLKTRE